MDATIRRRKMGGTVDGLVRDGRLKPMTPSTATGHLDYPAGRHFTVAGTETVSDLRYTVTSGLLNTAGTFACRVVPDHAGTDAGLSIYAYVRNAANNNMSIQLAYSNRNWMAYTRDSGAATIASGTTTFAAGTPHYLVSRWTQGGAGTLDLNHDGTTLTQVTQTKTIAHGTSVAIGSAAAAGDYAARGCVGPFIISPTRKSDAWTTSIQRNSGAAYSDVGHLVREFLVAGDMIFPLLGDSVGYLVVSQ